jgi:type 1 fimbria pilin
MKPDSTKYWAASLLAVAALSITVLSAAQGKQTFTGKITDDECPTADHAAMQMGDNDAECTVACVEVHGVGYVLYDGTHAYRLSDQQTPKKFAAQNVTVTGTLDSKTSTIQVDSIVAAK